jgi:2-dehydro-3-deoxyphosphogluconate aldolase/(4S)-4-hydroxy-2-oxoglutarate aldolase
MEWRMMPIADLFLRQRLMVILRGYSPDRTVELAERAWKLGIEVVEVPIQSGDGYDALAAAVSAGRDLGKPVGVGTVVTPAQLARAVNLGAAFAISPGFDPTLVAEAREHGLPYLPGVMSPSEVQAAAAAGLTHLKGFPASVLGPGWFKAMKGPFPDIHFVATGGVDANNATAFLDAGASAVAVGSALEDEEQLPLLAQLATSK